MDILYHIWKTNQKCNAKLVCKYYLTSLNFPTIGAHCKFNVACLFVEIAVCYRL